MAEPTPGRGASRAGARSLIVLRRGRRGRARAGRRHERAADRGPAGRLPHAAAHRRADRRDGLVAVARVAATTGPTRAVTDSESSSPILAARAADIASLTSETVGRRHRRRRASSGRAPSSMPPRAGCGPPSSSRTTSPPGPRRARRGSSTAGFDTSSTSGSGSSARRSRSANGSCSLAPNLVRIEPLLFPIYGIPFLSKAFYDAGLTLYDILGARHDGGWHRRLSKAATLELAPTLRQEGLRGGLVYHDGVEDDARYTLAVARTAIAAGAVAVTRVRATGLRTDPRSGVLSALLATDLADRHRTRDPDEGRRGCHRRLGGRSRPPVRAAAR